MSITDDADEYTLSTRKSGLGPSDVGTCRAYLGYRETGQEPDADFTDDRRASTVGTIIHEGVGQLQLKRRPDSLVEHYVDVPGLDRQGRLDWYVDGRVTDLKTLGLYAYDRLAERGRPWDKDRKQVNVYCLAMAADGFEVTEGEVLYYNRSSGHELSFTWPYDAAEAHADLAWLLGVQEAIDQGYELPRDGRGPGLGFPCSDKSGRSFCPFLATCWGVENVPEGRSPQSALVVTDADVIEAARAFLAAKLAKSSAEKDYESAQAALVGLGGVQVDLDGQRREVRWARESSWAVLDEDAAVALLDSEGLPVPTKVRTRRGALTIPVVSE